MCPLQYHAKSGSHYAVLAGLELNIQIRLASHSQTSACLCHRVLRLRVYTAMPGSLLSFSFIVENLWYIWKPGLQWIGILQISSLQLRWGKALWVKQLPSKHEDWRLDSQPSKMQPLKGRGRILEQAAQRDQLCQQALSLIKSPCLNEDGRVIEEDPEPLQTHALPPSPTHKGRTVAFVEEQILVLIKNHIGTGDMAQCLRVFTVLTEDLGSVLSPSWWFTTIYNCSFRECQCFSLTSQAPGMHVVHIRTWRLNTRTHKINVKKKQLFLWILLLLLYLKPYHLINQRT